MASNDVVDVSSPDHSVKVPAPLGCEHYQRKCAFVTPCCKKEYICRICHDNAEPHTLERRKVSQIKCLVCSTTQQVQEICKKCGVKFGEYYCGVCRLFDDTDKGQFHCKPCGICRVGGQDKFYHCMKCDMCLSLTMKGNHKCIEQATRSNCPICMEDLHSSRIPCHIPECGHYLHKNCYEQMLRTGNYSCPICNKSMVDMSVVWERLDVEVAATHMPQEYRDYHVFILCRDCHKESKVVFHVLGLKCANCGSYNTCRSEGPACEDPPGLPQAVNNAAPSDSPTDGSSSQDALSQQSANQQATASASQRSNLASGDDSSTNDCH